MENTTNNTSENVELQEVYCGVSTIHPSRHAIGTALKNGNRVNVMLQPKGDKVAVLYEEHHGVQSLIGYVLSKDHALFPIFKGKVHTINQAVDDAELLAMVKRSAVPATIVSAPSAGMFTIKVVIDDTTINNETTTTEAPKPKERSLDYSGIVETELERVEERVKYITDNCRTVSSKVMFQMQQRVINYFNGRTNIPVFNPKYINTKNYVEEGLKHTSLGENLILQGDMGTGKNTYAADLALFWALPLFDMSMTTDTSKEDLFGGKTITNGCNVEFEASRFIKAAQAGSIIVLDEINAGRAALLLGLHSMTDHRRYIELNDGKVFMHPDTRIILTMNEGEGYAGTKPLNIAFRDRFHEIIFEATVDDMDKVFAKRCNLNEQDAAELAKFYKLVYNAVNTADGDSAIPAEYLSQRKFIRAGRVYEAGLADSIEDAVISCCVDTINDREVRDVLNNLFSLHW